MRVFSTKFLFIFIASFTIFLTSCEQTELVSPTTIGTKTKKVKGADNIPSVTINHKAYNNTSSPFTIPNFTIEDEIIMLTATYEGGCGAVSFSLVADTKLSDYNGTPVIPVKLILDDNDPCLNSVNKEVRYNISKLQQPGTNEVFLDIDNVGLVTYAY